MAGRTEKKCGGARVAARRVKTLLLEHPERAARILRAGGIVAFPTETVYGLGAAINRPRVIRRLFLAKGRPGDNPLIVHIAERRQLAGLAGDIPPVARRLMDAFWPGPLTLVLRRARAVPRAVTAGLDTVGIRLPAHPGARAFLAAARVPVAAPSANRSGRPSPTSWEAVLEDLSGRADAILKGARCDVGLESTVVDCTGRTPVVLRAGATTLRQLRTVAPGTRRARKSDGLAGRSPGTRHRHYAPDARVSVGDPPAGAGARAAWIGIGRVPPGVSYVRPCRTVAAYARELFAFFRDCERRGIGRIHCRPVAARGLGLALMDRLRRAAAATGGTLSRARRAAGKAPGKVRG